jgi:uncharacterized membrane protein YecN with MAPEG domain
MSLLSTPFQGPGTSDARIWSGRLRGRLESSFLGQDDTPVLQAKSATTIFAFANVFEWIPCSLLLLVMLHMRSVEHGLRPLMA